MIYVIGGIAIDIIISKNKFIKNTSNIADITISTGGVGFNIFNNINVSNKCFISTIGNDFAGQLILENLLKKNIYNITLLKKYNNKFIKEKVSKNSLNLNKNSSNNLKTKYLKSYLKSKSIMSNTAKPEIYLLMIDNKKTAFYNGLMENGELLYGASNFNILENNLKFNDITKILNNINKNDIIVIESNLNPVTINSLINFLKNKNVYIFFETISVEKVKRVKNFIKNIFFTTPDLNEFKTLINLNKFYPLNFLTYKFLTPRLSGFLKNKNIKYLLLTRGKNGSTLFYLKNKKLKVKNFLPFEKLKLHSTNGAGDYLFSKIIECFHFNIIKNPDNKIHNEKITYTSHSLIINCIIKSIKKTENYLKSINY